MAVILDFQAAIAAKLAEIRRLQREVDQLRGEIPALAREALFLKDPALPEDEWHDRMSKLAARLDKYGVKTPDGEWINVEVRQ